MRDARQNLIFRPDSGRCVMNVLGVSYSWHESAACLVQDDTIRFACAEERLSGVKQDVRFPVLAIVNTAEELIRSNA